MGTKDFNPLDNLLAYWRLYQAAGLIEQNDRVLDFGCGYQAYLLKKIRKKINYGIGIDYEARDAIIGDNIKIINYTYKNKLPFPDQYFDKVVILAVIEHFCEKDADKLFLEINRILKQGGKIILSTPTTFGKNIMEFLANTLKIISSKEISDHKKYYCKKDFERIAAKTGFDVQSFKTFQFGINSLCVLKKTTI